MVNKNIFILKKQKCENFQLNLKHKYSCSNNRRIFEVVFYENKL